jgi:SAM-dependent methyltransferase
VKPAEYAIMRQVEESHWWYRALRRVLFHHLQEFLPAWQRQAILDGGCGTGANLTRLGNHALRVGIDLAPEAMAFCAERGLKNLVRGNVTTLPFSNGSFAGVVSASVLYHDWVPDVDQAVRECHRVLREGGVLLLELPACKSLSSAHDVAVLTARRFEKREVCEILRTHGFRVLRASYWNTLLFPVIWFARRLGVLKSGRDFGDSSGPSPFVNGILDWIMRVEFCLFRRVSLPFGVSLSCVAVKRAETSGHSRE